MKVDSTSTSNLSSPKGGVQGTRQGGQAAASAAPMGAGAASAQGPGGDASVSLSALSSQLRSLAASGEADIDVAHVESIKQAIADGTLTMDASKIADGILSTARELLNNPSTGG
ncbi:MAG TPA: flagellar biosynthesis anti-sigma factor FlgM [Trinickia sp.]